eukprot:9480134-Heterocapsa_arctica.AAC.1
MGIIGAPTRDREYLGGAKRRAHKISCALPVRRSPLALPQLGLLTMAPALSEARPVLCEELDPSRPGRRRPLCAWPP